jgi:tol-pal system protein YbgF
MRTRRFFLNSISIRSALSCLSVVGTLTISQSAWAFADDDARKAIVELRQQIKTMQEANQRARIQLADQIEGLEQEVMRLRGDMEQMGRPAPAANAATGTPGAAAPAGGRAPDAKSEDPREQASFDQAMESFRKGQYKETVDTLMAFMTLYPDSKLAPAALFYLGSSRYAQKDYKGAMTQLQGMIQKYPTHPRAPDALLVIAGCQVELNNKAGAKASLQRIVKDYKGTPAAETAAKRLQLLQ